MTISHALSQLAVAEQAVIAAVHEHYPVGTRCSYRRSSRTAPAWVEVKSWSTGTFLKVYNADTGKTYTVDGTDGRLSRV